MGLWDEMKKSMKEEMEKSKEAHLSGRTKSMKLLYLGGHPKIKCGKNGKEVTVKQAPEANTLLINGNEVLATRLEWDEKGKRSGGKAAAGAIIGGVVTAPIFPVGAIAGAAIGGRKKDNSLAILTVSENNVEFTIYFRCSQKEYQKLASLL
ncbi:hypothetical protein [Heyndrickxia sporothermodurans]|uniref:hypothetical protein n=1 Tax=Heyndrickxia sporothermodurans TaxID=46224 RepID=UPI0035D6FCDE